MPEMLRFRDSNFNSLHFPAIRRICAAHSQGAQAMNDARAGMVKAAPFLGKAMVGICQRQVTRTVHLLSTKSVSVRPPIPPPPSLFPTPMPRPLFAVCIDGNP